MDKALTVTVWRISGENDITKLRTTSIMAALFEPDSDDIRFSFNGDHPKTDDGLLYDRKAFLMLV